MDKQCNDKQRRNIAVAGYGVVLNGKAMINFMKEVETMKRDTEIHIQVTDDKITRKYSGSTHLIIMALTKSLGSFMGERVEKDAPIEEVIEAAQFLLAMEIRLAFDKKAAENNVQ
ncbi:MAG: hypothetical protein RSF00_04880 [Oscillospiraceae bacterium]